MAGVGAGVWPNVDTACAQTISTRDHVTPNKEASETYRSLYDQYQKLYPTLKPIFHNLSRLG